jgi:DNA-binding response OmpR family regulator
MRILIAEDEAISRRILESILKKWGYDVLATDNGQSALDELRKPDSPEIALLDWSMPGLDGLDVCRRLRALSQLQTTYIIFVTGKSSRENIVLGLQAGADDYITKPFDREELKARLQVGVRITELQRALARRVHDLEESLVHLTRLRRLLPICSYCRKVRNDQDYWEQVEDYLSSQSAFQLSHGICPTCWNTHVVPQLDDENETTPCCGETSASPPSRAVASPDQSRDVLATDVPAGA